MAIGTPIGNGQIMIRAGFGRNLTTAPTFPLDVATINETYDQYVMSDTPVGYWRCYDANATIVDDSTSENNGTWTSVTNYKAAAGPVQYSPHLTVTLDGSASMGQIPNNLGGGGDTSLVIWFKTSTLPASSTVAIIADKLSTWGVGFDSVGDIYLGATRVAVAADWTLGEWTCIRLKWQAAAGSVMVNDSTTYTIASAMARPVNDTLMLGTDKFLLRFLDGNIAEVAQYNSFALDSFYARATSTSFYMANITPFVRSWNCKRGRDYELDRIETGTGVIVLDNNNAMFTPGNTQSPIYPEIVPMKLVQILYANSLTAALDADWDSLFLGFIESYDEAWLGTKDSIVTLRIADLSKILAQEHVTISESAGQDSGAIIGKILDAIYPTAGPGWPTAMRDIDIGKSTMQAIDVEDVPALTIIQQIAASERGLFFVGADGKAVFHNRHARIEEFDTSSITLGDDIAGGEDGYVEIATSYDDTLLRNSVQITFFGHEPVKVTDDISRKQYGERRYEASDLLTQTVAEAEDMANWLLVRFKDAHRRITLIELYGQPSDSAAWEALLKPSTGDIATRVTIKRRPAVGDTISQDVHVDGIEHSGSGGGMRSIYSMTPADATTYWVWDSATNGVWDTSRWAY